MAEKNSSVTTSPTLLKRVRDRDPSAWVQFTRLYGPLVYRWARRCDLQPSDAADVSQDVFQAVAKSINNFDGNRQGATFRGWLWTITRNATNQHFRTSRKQATAGGGTDIQQRWESLPEVLASDEAPDDEDDRLRLLHRTMKIIRGDFDEQTWTAFQATALQGRSAVDVADELKVTAKSVRQAKYRVLCRLRETCDGL